jgi:gliding motility-associated-like protein
MKKRYFKLIILAILGLVQKANAQQPTVEDCFGAIPICQNVYEEPDPYSHSGNGNYLNEITKTKDCYTDENNGVWYIFTVLKTGALRFTITPHDMKDDYDWILFDLTNGNCSDLKANTSKYVVSTNNYGSLSGNNGLTGANSLISGGTAGHCNGPGDTNGPTYNDDITVNQGSTYVLYVSNWSKSQFGYKIDFSASTASIFDNVGPSMDKVEDKKYYTGQDTVKVYFSENVTCKDIDKNTFKIHAPNGEVQVSEVYSKICAAGGLTERQFDVIVETPFWPGLHLVELAKNATDACKNPSSLNKLPFEVLDITLDSVNRFHDCTRNHNGSIRVYAKHPIKPLLYSIDGGATFLDNKGDFTGLALGEYDVCIKTKGTYIKKIGKYQVEMPPVTALIDSLKYQDVTPCHGLQNGFINIFAHGGKPPLAYSIDFGRNYSPTSNFGDLSPGDFSIRVIDNLSCVLVGQDIKISQPPSVTFTHTKRDIDCYGNATGLIEIKGTSNYPPFTYSINGGTNYSPSNTFLKLKSGDYRLVINDNYHCASDTVNLVINQPPSFLIKLDEVNHILSRKDLGNGSIKVSGSGGAGNTNYILNFQTTNTSGDFDNLTVGKYLVWAEDQNRCTTDTLQIILHKKPDISIAKAFSPNGDGINDVWTIKNMDNYPDAEVKIFDRWGTIVFQSLGYDQPWDGTNNGKALPTASYYYHLSFKDGSGNEVGYITIIR